MVTTATGPGGTPRTILIVDDDPDLTGVTRDCLEDAGFVVRWAATGAAALRLLDGVHLILLDINLPDGTGFDVCRTLRTRTTIPILFISARTSDTDTIAGLDIGGDDYVPKPYSLRELVSRVRAHLRRCYPERVSFGDVDVDIDGRRVWRRGNEIALSAKEFDLLRTLVERENAAVARRELLSAVWGPYAEIEPSTLTVHIRWLREKLEDDPSHPVHITTAHRVGYMLRVPQ